jgi:hypothetical protein
MANSIQQRERKTSSDEQKTRGVQAARRIKGERHRAAMDGLLRSSQAHQARSHSAPTQVKPPEYISVKKAEYVSDYKLRLRFNDRSERIVDFGPFLAKPRHPEIEQYRELKKFKCFHLDHGDLMWGHYEMIFPVWELYHGEI